MRQVVLDTETTGIGEGHRILEIGCVEIIERKLTGRHFHIYINPDREIDAGAAEVHGITLEWLKERNTPYFKDIAQEFREFIDGAELVIHNAAFDIGMMDGEFNRLGLSKTRTFCSVLDTLLLARDMFPGQRNSLDALCKRLGIDNSHRELHGALLDAEILADVYLTMTGGQTDLALVDDTQEEQPEEVQFADIDISTANLLVIKANAAELEKHESMLDLVDKKAGQAIWRASENNQKQE